MLLQKAFFHVVHNLLNMTEAGNHDGLVAINVCLGFTRAISIASLQPPVLCNSRAVGFFHLCGKGHGMETYGDVH